LHILLFLFLFSVSLCISISVFVDFIVLVSLFLFIFAYLGYCFLSLVKFLLVYAWSATLNLELTPLDPDLERNLRRSLRVRAEMGDNQRNPRVEEHQDNQRNPRREEHEEYQDARDRNWENRRAYGLDFTTSLRELFAPTAVSSHSCIVLPPTNATHYDLKPHVIQMLPSFYSLDHENPYSHVKKFRSITATTKFQNFSEESVNLRLFPFSLHNRATKWLDSLAPGSIMS
jgi:hypothetical protein